MTLQLVRNLQLQLKQSPNTDTALEYIEAQVALLEGLVFKLMEAK
jgi:hypothetical protein